MDSAARDASMNQQHNSPPPHKENGNSPSNQESDELTSALMEEMTNDSSAENSNDDASTEENSESSDGEVVEDDGKKAISVEKTKALLNENFERCINRFEKLDLLGSGTYGEVFKARDKNNNEVYAVKKLKMEHEREGFPITALREVKILKMMDHRHVVKLHDVIASVDKPNFYMVFEYVEHDLAGLMDTKIGFQEEHLKHLMKHLLEGIGALHQAGVIHRDLKSSNLLISQEGDLKIADFGLARMMKKKVRLTSTVVTRWYRAPELLLGDQHYTQAIDMWSMGCILGEVLKRAALFPGKEEMDQIDLIFDLCGFEPWPGCEQLSLWQKMKPSRLYQRRLKDSFRHCHPAAVDLLDRLLQLDPKKRLTAKEALKHEWFRVAPLPLNPRGILPEHSCNELHAKRRRKEEHDRHKRMRSIHSDGRGGHPNKMRRLNNGSRHYPPNHHQHHAPPRGPPYPGYGGGNHHHQHHYGNRGHHHQHHGPPRQQSSQSAFRSQGRNATQPHHQNY